MSTEAAISCARMRELIDAGAARPLLPGRFPIPVVLDSRWWHLPAAGAGEVFVPAPAELATQLADLDARHRAADRAVARHDQAHDGTAPGSAAGSQAADRAGRS